MRALWITVPLAVLCGAKPSNTSVTVTAELYGSLLADHPPRWTGEARFADGVLSGLPAGAINGELRNSSPMFLFFFCDENMNGRRDATEMAAELEIREGDSLKAVPVDLTTNCVFWGWHALQWEKSNAAPIHVVRATSQEEIAHIQAAAGTENMTGLATESGLGTMSMSVSNFGGTPVVGDYDADGVDDVATYTPASGMWKIQRSSDQGTSYTQFGYSGALPVAADYDGDGKTDIAVMDTADCKWHVIRSTAGYVVSDWGSPEWHPKPVPADYDGDGKADIAIVYSETTWEWKMWRSGGGGYYGVQFGYGPDIAVPADYDGDGKADIAVYEPAVAKWYIIRSQLGYTIQQYGMANSIPVPRDYDGDGKAEWAPYNPAYKRWAIARSSAAGTGWPAEMIIDWGVPGCTPVPGDYDGDGRAGLAYKSGNTWYMLTDMDGDGMDDWFEYDLIDHAPSDNMRVLEDVRPQDDSDGDRLTNGEEFTASTDPANTDTDGDGLSDHQEVKERETDPNKTDTDGNGIPDAQEPIVCGAAATIQITAWFTKLYIADVQTPNSIGAYAHLSTMAECPASEWESGISYDMTYEGDSSHYGSAEDTYTTVYRVDADTLRVIVDCECSVGAGCNRDYDGNISLKRGRFTSDPYNIDAQNDPSSTATRLENQSGSPINQTYYAWRAKLSDAPQGNPHPGAVIRFDIDWEPTEKEKLYFVNEKEYVCWSQGGTFNADAALGCRPASTISWSSSDQQIATVDSSGIVHFVAPGEVTITASATGSSGTLSDELKLIVYRVDILSLDFVDSVAAGGAATDNNFDIVNAQGEYLVPGRGPEWTSTAGMVGETVYIMDSKVRASATMKITPVISGTPMNLEIYSEGDLDFTPTGSQSHSLTITFGSAGYASHTFTTFAKTVLNMMERKEYSITWKGAASGSSASMFIYTLYGKPHDEWSMNQITKEPQYEHLQYLLGPAIGSEGLWCNGTSTLEESTEHSIPFAIQQGMRADGFYRGGDQAESPWDVVMEPNGGTCEDGASLMRLALMLAGVPDGSIQRKSVVSSVIDVPSWFGGQAKKLLKVFIEPPGVPGEWLNEGVCGVQTTDKGMRYYDLAGPGCIGSGGWATPYDSNNGDNLWYEPPTPEQHGPVIYQIIDELYGSWRPTDEPPYEQAALQYSLQLLQINESAPAVNGSTVTISFRTEGVKDVGTKVRLYLWRLVNGNWQETQTVDVAIQQKWNNSQSATFTISTSGQFQVTGEILKADDTALNTDQWKDITGPQWSMP